jgi:periplasmic mercuric ion binding protein
MKTVLIFAMLAQPLSAFAEDSMSKSTPAKVEHVKSLTQAMPVSNELKVGVKGMVCAFCAQGIEKKFKAQKEVEKVEVSLENKFVKLTFKNGQRLTDEKIAQILKEAGYDTVFGG